MPEVVSIVASRSCPRFTVGLRKDGILVYEPEPGADVSYDFAAQVLELGLQLTEGRARPTLVLMQDVARVDRGARTLFASEAYLRLTVQTALVVSSPVSRVIGNFFLGLNRPQFQCKVFDDQECAVAWLRGASA